MDNHGQWRPLCFLFLQETEVGKNARRNNASFDRKSLSDLDTILGEIENYASLQDVGRPRLIGISNPFVYMNGTWQMQMVVKHPLEWKKLRFIDTRDNKVGWMVNQWTPANGVRVASYFIPQANRKIMLPPEATKMLLAKAWPEFTIDPEAILI